ncbi:serine/threonine-protein kinase SIK3 [Sarotherodon galilaeus]
MLQALKHINRLAWSKAGEGGVQRKQLPYSVETPYGFHLDLDFLKYVDDIEKGNTIKRVHIQRRVKGPPKFSTLPRNFSLPGHGVRPPPKEKDSTWSGTSTLGPKPKSRVTEVQQIFDFRANEGVTSSLSSRVTTSQGTSYVSTKPKDEVGAGARGVEDKTGGIQIQSRPNLLRASSMPITLQQRKSSDSSSPDRTVGTPENGSTENMFRASPDVTERRCVPQDRAGLHQQITVALKRVRELEEQVKTIPELKAQICSLREEREQLLLQLQAQAKAQASKLSTTVPTGYDPRTNNRSQGQRPSQEMKLVLKTQPIGRLEDTSLGPSKQATGKEKQGETEKINVLLSEVESSAQGESSMLSAQEVERQSLQLDIPDKQKETESPLGQTVQKLPRDISGEELLSITVALKETETAAKEGKPKDPDDMQKLQEKLTILEAKLIKASQELERTNSLLKQQSQQHGTGHTNREHHHSGSDDRDTPSSDAQTQPQGSRRSSSEAQAPQKDASETQSLRRGSSEAAQRRGSSEAQGSRRDTGEAQPPRRGSSESPTSPAALGQVVTRITGLLGEQGKVNKGFIDACLYVKDRMEEVSSPDKEMRQVLVVLYQEWFRVSSQKDSQADTVRLYLRQVGMTTPTLLPYVVNLTDGNGNMALHYSVSHSNFPVVKLLLDTGLCETDNLNKAGYTPVMLAALTAAESPDDLEVAQQLLKVGDVNARSRQAGQTALMLAVSHGRVAMVKLLLSCGADVNAQDREGSTALMCASEHGHTHIARLLLETGRCDTSLKDKNGQTALLVAEGASQQDIIDLLKANAEVQTSESTSTADLL